MHEPSISPVRVAIVQQPPVFLDRSATVEKSAALVAEAADQGAGLVVLPESFVPGYPEYIWRLSPGGDYDASREIHGRLVAQSVDLEADDLRPLRDAAARTGTAVVVGVTERDGAFSRATL